MKIIIARTELNAFVAPLDSSCCLTPRIFQCSGGSTALLPISAFYLTKIFRAKTLYNTEFTHCTCVYMDTWLLRQNYSRAQFSFFELNPRKPRN